MFVSVEKPYLWVDGSDLDYVNWASGEPDGAGSSYTNCVAQYIQDGKWYDADCNDFRGFVCKAIKGGAVPRGAMEIYTTNNLK